jgi:hypothetical protein
VTEEEETTSAFPNEEYLALQVTAPLTAVIFCGVPRRSFW